jgi:ADP-ribosyl-[dinitrogen reductase] hydrolase
VIGAIAGDIIGSRFEGHPAPPPGFDLFHPDCRFTDDTVCTLAVADALLGDGDFAATLRDYVRCYPDAGYGAMFLRWAFDDDAPAYGSWGNGAPMRVAAIGWLAETEAEADALAEKQAAVSHDHPEAVKAAQAVARAILLLRRGRPVREVEAWVTEAFGYDLRPSVALRRTGFDVSAAGTVPPALAAAFGTTDWESAVRMVVGLGGDTDTLACIAGAVAEAVHGVPPAIADQARARLDGTLRTVLDRFQAKRVPVRRN